MGRRTSAALIFSQGKPSMKSLLRFAVICTFLLAPLAGFSQTPATPKVSIGILPVYDASGEDYGEIFTQNMTHMLFTAFQKGDMQPILLNPGGAYTPLDTDLIKEYAGMSGVDAVVFSTMEMPVKPKRGDYTIKVSAQVMDVKTGKLSDPFEYAESIDRRNAIVEGGYSGFMHSMGWATTASRRFDKQPLGKIADAMANDMRNDATRAIPMLGTQGTFVTPAISDSECDVSFRVAYPDKRSISKSYGLIVNGKEESLWLKEGVASISMKSGPALIFVNVNDAPYRLPVQHMYEANTFVDCTRPSPQSLALEIGGAGEAVLKWK